MLEFLKAILYGILEGVTEWLPISSTGHLILLNKLLPLNVSQEFWDLFEVVIQLGAILAVILLFFQKLNPFAPSKSKGEKKATWDLWFHVIAAVLPSAVLGVLLDDWLTAKLYNYVTVAITLILYGVAFLLLERNKDRQFRVETVDAIDYKTALLIGAFQCLALIPGTSRSGSTILGAMILGVSRTAAAEFSFFLAIPTMLGASLLKAVKFAVNGVAMTSQEAMVLVAGCVVAFLVSLLVIRSLMQYVRRHTFSAFGIYRIALGALVLVYFLAA